MKCYSYIRFSSPEQSRGSSYQRQLEQAEKYAEKRNWVLDKELSMFDSGLSGFHQEHTSKGQLGIFLEAVRAGKIETPSALLVENLDRLSRANIPDALTQFLELIRSGVIIITLIDEQEYSPESIANGMTQLLVSISIMSRAHEESLVKQVRRSKAWEIERERARKGYKIKSRYPSWLKLSDDKTRFELIGDRVNVVRRIYEMYISGIGASGICKILNNEKVPSLSSTESKRGSWGATFVRKLLTARTVLGEVQFLKTINISNGRRVMAFEGDPIAGYYPQIIDNETFLKVKNIKESRSTPFGKVGDANNLFTGIAKCGYCGASMHYGIRGKGHKYLECSKANVGDCKAEFISFRYQDFEDVFLRQCTRLNLEAIFTDKEGDEEKKLDAIEGEMLKCRDVLAKSEFKVNRYLIAISSPEYSDDDVSNYFRPLIQQELEFQKDCKAKIEELDRSLNFIKNIYKNAEILLGDLCKAISKIQDAKGEDRRIIRRKLQFNIRGIVDGIDFYSAGKSYTMYKDMLKRQDLPGDIRVYLLKMTGVNPKTGRFPRTDNYARKQRTAIVRFKGGGVLQFANNTDTNELEFAIETKDGEGFELTERSRVYMERLFKRSAEKDNELLENELIGRMSKIESNDK